ncbi:ferritin heavy chain-like [Armigeres subalbatus]|uniref:ferritin heavy chain-like n=1 Tax=Armigeres subalbatus TaxID=124917 RepID=UPI002ED547B0
MFANIRYIPRFGTHVKRIFSSKPTNSPSCESGDCKNENLVPPLIGSLIQNAINDQINAELAAGYTYLSISYYFAKSTVGLLGFSKLYRDMSQEELDHAKSLARYLLERNGSVDLSTIRKPPSCSWSNISTTLNETLRLENNVSESLSKLYRLAEQQNDPTTADFIVTEFFKDQIESIRSVNLLVARWRTLDKAPDGVYLLDKELRMKKD